MAKIYHDTPEDIRALAGALVNGRLVVVPTETVYGLAVDVFNPDAVRSVFDIKGRPLIDPLIVHVLDIKQASKIATINASAKKLADAFWPGPLTLVLEKSNLVPNIVTAGLPTVAVRCPKHPVFRNLLTATQCPLAAPSANPFGYVSPTQSQHVLNTLGDKVDYFLEGGSSDIGIESTVLDISDLTKPTILRLGPISHEDIQSVLGQEVTILSKSKSQNSAQKAPGMLDKHYSPHTQTILIENNTKAPEIKNCAIVYFKKPDSSHSNNIFWLTESGDLNEASKNLYHILQKLDTENYTTIIVEKVPDHGIGIAINERLGRASF